MPEVLCPDGSIAHFPDGMSDDEIAAILKREFLDEPRPAKMEHGEVVTRRNGASVTFSASMARYVVHDSLGVARGFRLTLDEAIDLADSIQPPPPPRGKPQPLPLPAPDPQQVAQRVRDDVERHIRASESRSRLSALRDWSAVQRPRRRRR